MKAYRTVVSPKMAMEWLKKNHRNRPPHHSRVEAYAEEMRGKRWRLTGDTIKLDATGSLVDGQHRLMACVKSGESFETYVVDGVEASAFNVLDQGVKRTLGHAFGREKKKNYNCLAAAVRVLWVLEQGVSEHRAGTLGIDEGFDVLTKFPAAEHICDLVLSWKRAAVHTPPLSSACCAAFAIWTHAKHKDTALVFWQMVMTGENLAKGEPAHALCRRLNAEKDKPSTVIHRDVRMALAIKAFNAFIANKPAQRLSFDMGKEEMPRFA